MPVGGQGRLKEEMHLERLVQRWAREKHPHFVN